MTRPFAHLLSFVCLSFLLVGCGGGSSSPPPPPPSISVSFSTAPPTSLNVSTTAPVAVTVSNDSSNSGVTFTCLPAGACGTFTNVAAMSATYSAPATVPTGSSVAITATSVKDTTKSASANVTISNPAPAITVSFTSTFPASLAELATLPVTVSLTNDTTSAGVTFSCAPSGSCGTFTNTTATTATYNAPAAVPSAGSVTITATSVAQPTATKTSPSIAITGTASLASLKGQYAFLVHAPIGNRGIATWIGSVTLDGAGNVTGGIEEIASKIYQGDVADPILPSGATNSSSGYTVDPSGHGRLTMSTGAAEVLRMSFVLTSATHAEVIEADGSPGQGNPGSGTLDLQTPASGSFAASQISGTYSFTMVGVDDATSSPLSFGGSFSSDGNSNITGGSIDINSGASSIETDSVGNSVFDAPPDANGRGKFHFAVPNPAPSRTFVYYIVSPKVLRLIEADGVADMGGSAYLQPTSASSLSGNFVYQHSGWTSTTSRTVATGQFTLASSGSISAGVCDSNPGGGVTPTTTAPVTGSYAAPILTLTESAATSTLKVYPVDLTINILDPNNSSGTGGALFLHTDSSINGTGFLLPQQTPQPVSANYALNLMNAVSATPTELDLVGILTGGTTGLADYDQVNTTLSNPMLGAALSASLPADASHAGRYTGNITITPPAAAVSPYSFIPGITPPTTFKFSLYQANASQALGVETDNKANIAGRVVQQNLP